MTQHQRTAVTTPTVRQAQLSSIGLRWIIAVVRIITRRCAAWIADMVCGLPSSTKIILIHWNLLTLRFDSLTSKAYHCCVWLKYRTHQVRSLCGCLLVTCVCVRYTIYWPCVLEFDLVTVQDFHMLLPVLQLPRHLCDVGQSVCTNILLNLPPRLQQRLMLPWWRWETKDKNKVTTPRLKYLGQSSDYDQKLRRLAGRAHFWAGECLSVSDFLSIWECLQVVHWDDFLV